MRIHDGSFVVVMKSSAPVGDANVLALATREPMVNLCATRRRRERPRHIPPREEQHVAHAVGAAERALRARGLERRLVGRARGGGGGRTTVDASL